MLIGDAAACVDPLNGEGIDYGLENGSPPSCSGRGPDVAWPTLLQPHDAQGFSVARRLALR